MRTQAPSALPRTMPDEEILAEHQAQLAEMADERDGNWIAGANGDPIPASTSGDPDDRELFTSASVGRTDVSLLETIKRYRDADICLACGKTRAVVNVAGRHQPFRAERVTADTHCACVGGPAYRGIGSRSSSLEPGPLQRVGTRVAAVRALPYTAENGRRIRYIGAECDGTITVIDAARGITTLQFDGHPQPYLCTTDRLAFAVRALPFETAVAS